MKIFHVGSHQFRESLRELLRESCFSHCTSRETPFREWDVAFRELPFHQRCIPSVNNSSGINFHMQLQFWTFPELFVYTVTVPFSRWTIFIYRSSVYRHPPALPPAPLSFRVPLFSMLWLFRSKSLCPSLGPLILGKTALLGAERTKSMDNHSILGCRANKSEQIGRKTALLGAERTKSLEKQRFWVQSELNLWKKQRFCLQSEQNPLEKQHFWVQNEQDPWGSSFVLLGSALVHWWGLRNRWSFGWSYLFMQLQLANFQELIL